MNHMAPVDEYIDSKIKSYVEEIASLKRQNALLKQELSDMNEIKLAYAKILLGGNIKVNGKEVKD